MSIKFNQAFRLLCCLTFVVVLALSGCAKKPAPDEGMAGDGTTTSTEMSSQDVQGIDEGSMRESDISESGSMSGMEGAGMDSALERIHFEFDQYTLTMDAQETLANNAAYLKANPGVKVRIEGHCDERGSDEYNLALGERRAISAQKYLETAGIEADRLSIISYGEEKPLDTDHDEQAWAMNRRAEFVVIK